MTKYSLVRIEQVRGKQVFDKLVVNGVAPFDVFIEKLERIYKKELKSIYAYMDLHSNLVRLPSSKFHALNESKDGVKEYEFKTKHLRVYVIEEPGGKIVVIGGKKSTQPKDISEFRRLKTDYLKSL